MTVGCRLVPPEALQRPATNGEPSERWGSSSSVVDITIEVTNNGTDTYLRLGPEPLLLIPPLDELATALPIAKALRHRQHAGQP